MRPFVVLVVGLLFAAVSAACDGSESDTSPVSPSSTSVNADAVAACTNDATATAQVIDNQTRIATPLETLQATDDARFFVPIHGESECKLARALPTLLDLGEGWQIREDKSTPAFDTRARPECGTEFAQPKAGVAREFWMDFGSPAFSIVIVQIVSIGGAKATDFMDELAQACSVGQYDLTSIGDLGERAFLVEESIGEAIPPLRHVFVQQGDFLTVTTVGAGTDNAVDPIKIAREVDERLSPIEPLPEPTP